VKHFYFLPSIFFLFSIGCSTQTYWRATEYAKTSLDQALRECDFETRRASIQGGPHNFKGNLAAAFMANKNVNNLYGSCMGAKGFIEYIPPPPPPIKEFSEFE